MPAPMRARKTLVLTRRLFERLRSRLRRNPDRFLRKVPGVIHVGANAGQEAEAYKALGLDVLWVEPIPEVFARLESNIRPYPNQRALQALLTDQEGMTYSFHVSNNDGQSSSLFDLDLHRDIWPTVHFVRTIQLTSTTLPVLLSSNGIDARSYPALVLDTQGSELLILQGAEPILENFLFIKAEAADFPSYTGCCQLSDLSSYLARHGFRELARSPFAEHPGGGRYYDVAFVRVS